VLPNISTKTGTVQFAKIFQLLMANKKPASQLFKYELKKYVGQSNVAFEDLSKLRIMVRHLKIFLVLNQSLM
jgi:hypothetical protein